MKITNLKQQVKNPERISVFVDDKYSFSLSLDQLAELKIKNDQEITEAELKKYKKISEDGKVKDRALAWLMSRPHYTREFYDYMRRKKVDSSLADELANYFTQRKYLNDETYAKWLVEMRTRGNKSNRAIKSELFKKGISREVVEIVLDEPDGSEESRLREVVAKKAMLSRYKSNPGKLIRYLTSQGFSYNQIKQELKINQPED